MLRTETLDLFKVIHGLTFHSTATSAVSAADATSDASALTLAGDIRTKLSTHFASVQTSGANGAHSAADTTTELPSALADTSRTYAEALRGALNDHVRRADLHFAPDTSNMVSFVCRDGSDAETWRLLNAVKAAANAHFANVLAAVPA